MIRMPQLHVKNTKNTISVNNLMSDLSGPKTPQISEQMDSLVGNFKLMYLQL